MKYEIEHPSQPVCVSVQLVMNFAWRLGKCFRYIAYDKSSQAGEEVLCVAETTVPRRALYPPLPGMDEVAASAAAGMHQYWVQSRITSGWQYAERARWEESVRRTVFVI